MAKAGPQMSSSVRAGAAPQGRRWVLDATEQKVISRLIQWKEAAGGPAEPGSKQGVRTPGVGVSPGLLGWAGQGARPHGGSPETLGIFVERMGWAESWFPESRGLGRVLPPVLFRTDHPPRALPAKL